MFGLPTMNHGSILTKAEMVKKACTSPESHSPKYPYHASFWDHRANQFLGYSRLASRERPEEDRCNSQWLKVSVVVESEKKFKGNTNSKCRR